MYIPFSISHPASAQVTKINQWAKAGIGCNCIIVYSYIQKSVFYSDAFSSLIHHTYMECLNYFSWNLLTGKGRKRAKEIANRGVRILLCQLIP